MNIENTNKLIERLQQTEHSLLHPRTPINRKDYFNLQTFRWSCGSPSCIGGHVAEMMIENDNVDKLQTSRDRVSFFVSCVSQYLDVSPYEAQNLCCPNLFGENASPLEKEGYSWLSYHHVTPAMAVEVLQHMLQGKSSEQAWQIVEYVWHSENNTVSALPRPACMPPLTVASYSLAPAIVVGDDEMPF